MYGEPKQGWLKPLMLRASASLAALAAHVLAAPVLLMPSDPPTQPKPQPVAIMIELAPKHQAVKSDDDTMPLPDNDTTNEADDLARVDPAEEGISMEYA